MNTKRKWYDLLLPGLAVLLVLAVGAVQTARAGYYSENTGNYTDKSSTVDEDESTYKRQLTTLATATVQTTSCHASLVNYVWTKGSTKSLYGYAESWVRKDWTWVDPPPDDGPGGTLTWSYSAEGKPAVYGENDIPNPETQEATSVATADSDTSATLTSGGPVNVTADANGYVIDDGASGGGYKCVPTSSITDSGKTTGGSSYAVFVEYEIDDNDVESIPANTNYIYVKCETKVSAYAFCGSSGGAESEAFITSTADADFDATFE